VLPAFLFSATPPDTPSPRWRRAIKPEFRGTRITGAGVLRVVGLYGSAGLDCRYRQPGARAAAGAASLLPGPQTAARVTRAFRPGVLAKVNT